MKKNILLISSLLLGFLFMFTSCTKVGENIENTWKLETMQANPQYEVYWDFQGDGVLVRTMPTHDYIDTANYEIQDNITYKTVKILNTEPFPSLGSADGFFRVDEITDKILVLTRYELEDESTEGAFLRREFTKSGN